MRGREVGGYGIDSHSAAISLRLLLPLSPIPLRLKYHHLVPYDSDTTFFQFSNSERKFISLILFSMKAIIVTISNILPYCHIAKNTAFKSWGKIFIYFISINRDYSPFNKAIVFYLPYPLNLAKITFRHEGGPLKFEGNVLID